ncbi:hypothetical protein FJZ36_00680 [Candidatus Poribacteria bacterium]|nr:hypothetical protein [Candidatus Poribacteria bacterium]
MTHRCTPAAHLLSIVTAFATALLLTPARDSHAASNAPLIRIIRAGSSQTERFAREWSRVLEAARLPRDVVTAGDVRVGSLDGVRVAVLAHTPDLPPAAGRELVRFVRAGGKVIVCYSLPSTLAGLLGIEGSTWRQEREPGEYSAIRFERSFAGSPERVLQGSWNVNVPRATSAQAIGYWERASGEDTGLPAVTVNANGAFIGHVLLPGDRDAKVQFVRALLCRLLPGLSKTWVEPAFDELPPAMPSAVGVNDQPYGSESSNLAAAAKRALDAGSPGDALALASQARRASLSVYYASVPPKPDEFRAVWCHSAFGVPGLTWDEALRRLSDQGFNAVLPNMLWGGLAYYPSDILPVAAEVSERGDQIQECLDAARRHGIAVHVWKVNWGLSTAPDSFVARMRAEKRLQRHRDGSERLWLCPSDPRNLELETESMVEVVRRYPVDGIHFDYIRYPDSDSCFCDGCLERFQRATGKLVRKWPADATTGSLAAAFADWRRNQITALVRAVNQRVREARPGVQVSAAVFADYPTCRDTVGQDWAAWIQEGYLDFVCPMDYTDNDARFRRLVEAQLGTVGGRVPLYPGIGASAPGLTSEQVVRQVVTLRELGAQGFVLFNYDADVLSNHLPALRLGATSDSSSAADTTRTDR